MREVLMVKKVVVKDSEIEMGSTRRAKLEVFNMMLRVECLKVKFWR